MKKLIEKYGKLRVVLFGALIVILIGLMVAHGSPTIALNQ